ncbi:MAG: DinB family protein [Fimbriimonadaceae bacterium]|nr:DinB family protein [Fimbriimonadaceae bacterium]
MAIDIKAHISDRIRTAAACYAGDLAAMSEEALANSLGGVARSPYDYTYEVIFVNRRFAARIRGEEPAPFKMDGWIMAPEEYKNRDYAVSEFNSSVQEVLDAWEALPEDQYERVIPLPHGEPTSPFKLAAHCASHITYHDGQLNYHQAALGDSDMHWN